MKNLLIGIIILFSTVGLFASSVEEDILKANNTLKSLVASEDIPMSVFKKAKAVVIVPDLIRLGYFIGGRHGDGVATVRRADGSWSYPFFVTLSGGSFGFQIGFERIESVLIFRTKESVDRLLSNQFTLGVEASVSAGPASTNVGKTSELDIRAEIFSYSRGRGLFAGAALEGAVISSDDEKTRALYGSRVGIEKVVRARSLSDLFSVQEFLKTINSLAGK